MIDNIVETVRGSNTSCKKEESLIVLTSRWAKYILTPVTIIIEKVLTTRAVTAGKPHQNNGNKITISDKKAIDVKI